MTKEKILTEDQVNLIAEEISKIEELFPGESIDQLGQHMIDNQILSPFSAFAELNGDKIAGKMQDKIAKAEESLGSSIDRELLVEEMSKMSTADPYEAVLKLDKEGRLDPLLSETVPTKIKDSELDEKMSDEIKKQSEEKITRESFFKIEPKEDETPEFEVTKENLPTLLEAKLSGIDANDYDKKGRKKKPYVESGASNLEESEKKEWQKAGDMKREMSDDSSRKFKEERSKKDKSLFKDVEVSITDTQRKLEGKEPTRKAMEGTDKYTKQK